jgi:hypothetical protein
LDGVSATLRKRLKPVLDDLARPPLVAAPDVGA